MRTTTCPKCNKEKKVIRYERDDPVLSCGHILTIDDQLVRDLGEDGMFEAIRDEVYSIMRKERISYRQAVKVFWSKAP